MSNNLGAKALITCDDFFLGHHLSEFLLNRGCQVIFLADFTKLSPQNVRELASREGFFFERQKPFSPHLFKRLTKDFSKVDYFFHLDGYHLGRKKEKPLKTDLENFIKGVENFLKLVAYYRARFLLGFFLDFSQKKRQIKDLKGTFGKKDSLAISSLDEAQEVAEKLVLLYFQQEKLNARLLRLGEIFGPEMSLDQKGEVTKIIRQITSGGPVKIPGDGRREIAPLFIGDAVSGIARAMFAPSTSGEIFTLLGERVSLLEFAQNARKNFSPRAEIEFVAEEKDHPGLVEGKSPSGWRPKTPLDVPLKKTFAFFCQKDQLARIAHPPQAARRVGLGPWQAGKKELPKEGIRKKAKKETSFWKTFLTVVCLILLTAFSPFAFLGVNLFLSYHNLVKAASAASQASFEEVLERSRAASAALSRSRRTISLVSPAFKLVGFGDWLSQAEKSIFLAQMVAQTSVEGGYLARQSGEFFRSVILGQEVDLDTSLSQIKLSLQTFLDKASLTQSLLEQFSPDEPLFGSKVALLREKLPLVREMGEQAREIIDVTPEILGARQRRTYLVLFQNNMEIRPTGGFIGSFGLITFEKGRLLDFEIQDVYSADGQLRGHVEPPAKLGEFLGLSGWYLRDSNWDPNFPTSARRAEWFLEKEIGRSVDGVIGVDLFTLEKILEQVGEVYLPDYDEKISSKNFFERAQYHIEAGFFPGSTGKKDYLGTVADALFEEIKSRQKNLMAKIATSLYLSLEGKDILVYLHFPQAAGVISQLGWDGAIGGVDCTKAWPEKCFPDFLMLVEANVGINKANFWMKREIRHEIEINKEGKVAKKTVIDYENRSPNDIFPAGRYKNYLRIFTPLGSTLDEVKIIQGTEEKEPKVDQQDEHKKTVFGFLVEVPVGERRRVEIDFSLPEDQTFSEGNYVFLWQKQPGAFADPVSVKISLPENLALVETKPFLALTEEGALGYNTSLSEDLIFQIKLVKD